MKPGRADPSVFGHIPGIPVGKTWDFRQDCSDDAVHPGIMKGIYGRKQDGARSVVLSGGYEDDEDKGDTFTYTGCGGRDLSSGRLGKKLRTGPQAYDQDFEDEPLNMALKISSMTGLPVRVVRGFKLNSVFAPAEGYRYDGLYRVIRAWREKGKAGYLVCRYEFRRLPGQPDIPRLQYHPNHNRLAPKRKSLLPNRRRLETPISHSRSAFNNRSSSPRAGPSVITMSDSESIRSASPKRKTRSPSDSDIEDISDSNIEEPPPRRVRRDANPPPPRLRTDKIKKGSVPLYKPSWVKS